ncbi:MAG: ROK family protein [Bifidobacteriaceae bacterium]|nr:ROK family protein [Bifidobacteriaceae bacterium]
MNIVVFDVGGTFVKAGLFSEGALVAHTQIPTPRDSAEAFYAALAEQVRSYDHERGGSGALDGVSISMPGFIDTTAQRAVLAGALPALYGRKIGEELATTMGRKLPTWLENDANCAAMAEKLSGGARDASDFVVLTLGTGVGGAVFINDRIFRGRDFRAGEFGMMFTDVSVGDGQLRAHELASTSALVTAYAESKSVAAEAVDGRQILEDYDSDPATRSVVDRWASHVAAVIFNVAATLDPQRILLGGGISRNERLVPILQKALARNRYWKDFSADLRPCTYYNEAGLYGAYYAIMSEIFKSEGRG